MAIMMICYCCHQNNSNNSSSKCAWSKSYLTIWTMLMLLNPECAFYVSLPTSDVMKSSRNNGI